MNARLYLASTAVALAATVGALPAGAEEIKLTAISGHPPVTLGVAYLRDFYIPEVNKRLAAAGKHKIAWTEAYGGSVAKPAAVLEAIEKGIGDVGYMPALFEADKLPLDQITYVTPFGSGDLPKVIQVSVNCASASPRSTRPMSNTSWSIWPASASTIITWSRNFRSPAGPISTAKNSAPPASLRNWLKGTGAVPVSGALTTYYNSLQTGVIDGIITFEFRAQGL